MAKEIKIEEFQTEKEIEETINNLIPRCSHFKIGKTGENLEDRAGQPDYQEYDYIQSLFTSNLSDLISILEKIFINKFINNPKNDNEENGNQSFNDKMSPSNEYHLYIVWK